MADSMMTRRAPLAMIQWLDVPVSHQGRHGKLCRSKNARILHFHQMHLYGPWEPYVALVLFMYLIPRYAP